MKNEKMTAQLSGQPKNLETFARGKIHHQLPVRMKKALLQASRVRLATFVSCLATPGIILRSKRLKTSLRKLCLGKQTFLLRRPLRHQRIPTMLVQNLQRRLAKGPRRTQNRVPMLLRHSDLIRTGTGVLNFSKHSGGGKIKNSNPRLL